MVADSLSLVLMLRSSLPVNSFVLLVPPAAGKIVPVGVVGMNPWPMKFCAAGSILAGSIMACAASVGLD